MSFTRVIVDSRRALSNHLNIEINASKGVVWIDFLCQINLQGWCCFIWMERISNIIPNFIIVSRFSLDPILNPQWKYLHLAWLNTQKDYANHHVGVARVLQ